MRTFNILFALLVVVLAGCDNKELEQRNDQLRQELASKDAFIEEITSTINEINEKVESAWAMEKNILRQAKSVEGSKSMTQAELKQHILDRISEMSSKLVDNRKKVTDLQKRLKGAKTQYTGLQGMVDDLKKNLDERERSLAELQTRVQNLEGDILQKVQVIAAHEITISDQTRRLNTVYYTVGKRSELKEKGVITEEGGFLWGLLGSTTVIAPNYDGDQFERLDKTTEMTIQVVGPIDELVPKRDQSSYVAEATEDGRTVLRITRPDQFWRENRLVIVTD